MYYIFYIINNRYFVTLGVICMFFSIFRCALKDLCFVVIVLTLLGYSDFLNFLSGDTQNGRLTISEIRELVSAIPQTC